MKNQIIAILFVCAFVSSAFASDKLGCHYAKPDLYNESYSYHEPYLGAEVIFTDQNYKPLFGKGVFPKNSTDYSIFGGAKFHRHFGLELGYELQPTRAGVVRLNPGDTAPGALTLTAGRLLILEASNKSRHPYLGITGEYPTNWYGVGSVKLVALIGLSLSNIRARTAILADEAGAFTQAQYDQSIRFYAKTKIIPMAKIGVALRCAKHLDVRAAVTYRALSQFKIVGNTGGLIKLQDTLGFGLSLIYLI